MIGRKPRVVFAQAPPAALALKAATTTIPIVFAVGFDPVSSALVASLNRPGGNVTGMAMLNPALGPKRLEILKELMPGATKVAMLLNPSSPDAAPEMTPISRGRAASRHRIPGNQGPYRARNWCSSPAAGLDEGRCCVGWCRSVLHGSP